MTTIRRPWPSALAVFWLCLFSAFSLFAQIPTILSQPTYTSAASGSDVTFSVTAASATPLAYRWRFFGTNLPGRTNAALTINNVQLSHGGLYSVVVSNASGAVTSAPAFLAIDEHLTFRVLQLQTNGAMAVEHAGPTGDDRGGIAVTPGYVFVTGDNATARFSATDLTGAVSLGRTYDSLCGNLRDESIYVLGNGGNIVDGGGGPVNSLLQLDNVTGLPNGVRINLSTNIPSNDFGSPGIFSGYDRIVIWNGRDVYDISLPSGNVTMRGQLLNFSHNFTENWAFWGWAEYFNNTLNLCYVSGSAIWRRPVAPNSVATVLQQFSSLSDMASIGFSRSRSRWYFHHEGTSQFRSGDETVGSAKALYSTNGGAPFIYQNPLPQVAYPGDTLTLNVGASGPEPLLYQWRLNGIDINGATGTTLVLTNIAPSAGGDYSVQVSSTTASTLSANAFVMVVSAPQITVQPQPASAVAGTNAFFTVGYLAAPPVHFQWRHNGTNIPNATNATLNLPVVTTADVGGYNVVITNRYGSVTSSVAALTLIVEAAYSFKILSLSNDAVVVDHANITGDDRGGIAVSSNQVLLAGDAATGLFSADDLSGGTPLTTFYDALITDLRTERIYSLGRGTNLFQPGLTTSTNITTLIEIDGTTGARTTNIITLSAAIPIAGEAGLFAGYGQLVIHNGTRVYSIAMPSGVVADLGQMFPPQHQGAENWAYWGLAENFGGSIYLAYGQNFISIARTRVPDGITTTIANFLNLSDMASISASVRRGRWYFHHEGASQFGGTDETIGFASAAFSVSANPIVDHFSWEPLPGAQFAGVPFSATVTARNIEEGIVQNFSGQVSFTAFTTGNGAPVAVTPLTSGNFTNGTWSGLLSIPQPAVGVVVRAADFAGRFGISAPFAVVTTNDLAVQLTPSTNAATLYAALTYHVLVTNSGPEVSSSVFATNVLPINAAFISANTTQGACVFSNGVVVCNIGSLASGASAAIAITVVPNALGTLTNRVAVVRSAPEAHPENNSAVVLTTVSLPAITFNDASSAEGNSVTSRGTNTFVVQLNTTSAVPVSVRYATATGTATNTDFGARSGLIVFEPGVTSSNINVVLAGEQNFELDEMFFLNFSSATNAILVRTQAIGTIINDDAAPGITVADQSVNEGNAANLALTFPVRLSVPASVPIVVSYSTSNGTAIAGSDYVPQSASLVYLPGSGASSTNLFVTINIIGDALGESNEFFYVNFSATNIGASAQMVIVINNDDPANVLDHFIWSGIGATQVLNTPFDVTLSARDAVDRPLSNYNGTVNLNAGAGALGAKKILGDVNSVDFFNGGPYTIGFEFTPSTNIFITHVRHYSGTKVSIWTDTGTLVVSRAVNSINGKWVETPLATPVRLNAGTRYRLGGFNGTDANPWYFGGSLPPVFEFGTIGNGYYADGDAFPIFDLGSSLYMVDLAYTLNLFTFSMSPTNATFTNGAWGGTARVLTPGAGVQLFASTANNLISSASDPFDVLLADDLAVAVAPSANPVAVGENLVYSITVSNSGPTISSGVFLTNILPANATYISATNDHGSTSTSGGRVIASIGTLTNGEAASLTIAVRPNAAATLTNVTLVRRNTPEPFVANNSVTTVVNATPLTLSFADTFVLEGQSGTTNAVFRVGLSAVSTRTVSVVYRTSGGAFSNSTPGVDYQATNGVLVFAPGLTERFITVPVFGDLVNESDEFFVLTLTNATNATIDFDTATAYIVNDDPLPMISVADIAVPEGRTGFTPATFTLTLTPASGFAVDVSLETADASATTNDYAQTNFFVTFAPGQTTAQVTVPVRGDGSLEPDEFFLLNLFFPANATLATAQARGIIVNDDGGAAGTLSYFEWGAIPSPQTVQRGIDVTITARDGADAIFPFTGTVSLAALQGTNAVALTPTNAAAFVNGVWSGTITLFSPGTNVVLVASNGAGNVGVSDPFEVNIANIGLGVSAPPQVLIASPFNYSILVTNFGPQAATQVSLSNALPADAIFVSASSSGGGCSYANGILTCELDGLGVGQSAQIAVSVNPLRGGPLASVFRAGAFEFDPALSNNVVTNITAITGDEDHDALPDAWEIDNGFSSADPNDAHQDSDRDGHTSLQEYVAGTDPRSAASVLRVSASIQGASARVQFTTVTGIRYALESAPSPNGPWTTLGNEVLGDGDLAIISDPNPPVAVQRFYRLRVVR